MRFLLRCALRTSALSALVLGLGSSLWAQPSTIPIRQLDPARNPARLKPFTRALPVTAQYIWTQGGAQTPARNTIRAENAQWEFRRVFTLAKVPRHATLYVAASGDVSIWLNGERLLGYFDNRTLPPGYTVHALPVAAVLRAGRNALALRVDHLHGAHHSTTDALILQYVGGRAIAVKLVPAARGEQAAPLMVSDTKWRGRMMDDAAAAGNMAAISTARYNGTAWPAVSSIGGIESNIDFYQWNADAGMYAWPGYVGASPFLRQYTLDPVRIVNVYAGSATVSNMERLTHPAQDSSAFTVRLSPHSASELSPALMLDFGREVAGRIRLRSDSNKPILVSTSYGESEGEALHQPFLGVRTIYIPPHGEAYGPKSGFRYVRIRFLTNARLAAINVDGIAYPVEYKGSFASPDAMLNRIWATGAYTAHLCMQDDIWDGVKRDRARWAGDLDVSGRVINDVFAGRALMEDTYARLIEETGGTRAVNGIDGYSALWIDGLAAFYRHTGDHVFLLRMHGDLLALLRTMNRDIGPNGLFAPLPHEHFFVDWSPGLSANTPEARRATDFEYVLAYKEAAWLLGQMGDRSAAAQYAARYRNLRDKARMLLMNPVTHTFGATWQTNAMAVLSGVATPADYAALWNRVFSNIDDVTPSSPRITPYYGYYVLEAMSKIGHSAQALRWLSDFWGGMIDEGATSFWEAYDPRWTKRHPHTGLEADGVTGYYVSLAHGWSAGPTAWLSDELLGVRPTGAGFRTVTIEPELAGLPWIEGSVPTPHGIIHLRAEKGRIALDLPSGVDATVLVRASGAEAMRVNGAPVRSGLAPVAGYRSIQIDRAGQYEIVTR